MARFNKCPQQQYLKWCGKSCDDFDNDHCDGCNMLTAYQLGRADALEEALELQRNLDRQSGNKLRLDDETWKEDMKRDAQLYEAGE